MKWTEKTNLDRFELVVLYASVAYKLIDLIFVGGSKHAKASSAGLGCASAAAMPQILPGTGLIPSSCK